MSYETDWLKVGTAGATVDGRVVKEEWLSEMEELYDPIDEIKAQVWAWSHYNHYQTYGKVTAFKSENDSKGRLSAFVKISPLPELVSLNRAGQLQHASMEIHPNYKREGKAYLTGLLLTNDPASIGTEEIHLSAGHAHEKESVYSEAFKFSAVMNPPNEEEPSWFKRAMNKYFDKIPPVIEDDDEMKPEDFAKMEAMFDKKIATLRTDIVTELSAKTEAAQDNPANDGGDGGDGGDAPTELEVAQTALTAEKEKVVALEKQKTDLEAEVVALGKPADDLNTDTQDTQNLGSNDDGESEFLG